jgi:hypothetical protein
VEIVTVFGQEFSEGVAVIAAEIFKKLAADSWDIYTALSFLVAETFARWTVIGAKVRVGLHRGTVHMEREDIGGYWPGMLIAGIVMDTVKHRIQVVLPEQPLIGEHYFNCGPARSTGGKTQ